MFIIICCLTAIVYNNSLYKKTNMFRIGPNPELYIIGICINTNLKYGILVSFCFINSGMRVMNINVLHSWIINELQDTKNKNIIDKNKAYIISLISVAYTWFDFFMYMNILLSQIDMLLIETFADLIMTFCLTTYYLKIKNDTSI